MLIIHGRFARPVYQNALMLFRILIISVVVLLNVSCSTAVQPPGLVADQTEFCPNGLIVSEKDLNSGTTTIARYYIDDNFCSVERIVAGNKVRFHSVFGAIPPRNFTNYDDMYVGFRPVLTGAATESEFVERGLNAGGTSAVAHIWLTRLGESLLQIGGRNYPTVRTSFHGINNANQQLTLEMSFSSLPDGKIFVSQIKTSNPSMNTWALREVVTVISYDPGK